MITIALGDSSNEVAVPAFIISALALFLTAVTFWNLNLRQGKLRVAAPHSFAAQATSQLLLLRFPLVLFNDGAKPIVVQNLRLRFVDEQGRSPLLWRNSRVALYPAEEDVVDLPAVFAVRGRDAVQRFIEFGAEPPEFVPQKRDYRVCIEAAMAHKRGWRSITTFPLRAGAIKHPDNYIAYSNSPDGSSESRSASTVADDLMQRGAATDNA